MTKKTAGVDRVNRIFFSFRKMDGSLPNENGRLSYGVVTAVWSKSESFGETQIWQSSAAKANGMETIVSRPTLHCYIISYGEVQRGSFPDRLFPLK